MEQIKNPVLSREQIAFFIEQYRKTDISDEVQRQRLIDCFVNAVFVYDDKIVLTFNYAPRPACGGSPHQRRPNKAASGTHPSRNSGQAVLQ